ncbi:transposase [Neolewinella lacunae]|uniref:Transposase n=1 Tax=Neolewinella lacunae TaxID=1517758 RepID=A0A923T948_9BACT|nr:transposase [Neolewinella lacunae]MBC6995184.1 transposase [Neolewinella lacunae]MDN3634134.1 transposase [Neolewinella lacunae]
MSEKPRIVVEPNKVYHILNRGNDYQFIFQDSKDYEKFLHFLFRYIHEIGFVIAYALMPNHFHLIVQTKKEQDILPKFKANIHTIGNTFGHLQNAYAKYYNHRYQRKGSLFEKGFERVEIKDRAYLRNCIVYLHLNSTKHRIAGDFKQYPWTSYQKIATHEEIFQIDSRLHIALFGGKQKFIEAHDNRDLALWTNFLEI